MARQLEITVANREQQILLECELKGQLSGGNWENARPHRHWVKPCEARVVVDPAKVGSNFYQVRKYNFTDAELLDAVGQRMLMSVMMGRKYPTLSIAALRFCDNGKWAWTEEAPYYAEVRAELAAVGIVNFDQLSGILGALAGYTMKDLKKDLNALKVAFNTYRA